MSKKVTTNNNTSSDVINVSDETELQVTAGLITDVHQSDDIDLSEFQNKPKDDEDDLSAYQDDPYAMCEAVYTEQGRVGIDKKPPSDQEFFKVHPEWCLMGANIIIHKKTGDYYLVNAKISKHPAVEKHVKKMDLYVAHFTSGTYFVIANPSDPKNDKDRWHSSAESKARILLEARTKWTVMRWNNETSAYDPTYATGTCQEPKWPDSTGIKVIKRAFREGKNLIDSADDDLITKLNGVNLV